MWPTFVHHITLHFPIVLTVVVGGVGVWSLSEDIPQFRTFIRWVGWASFLATTITVMCGILAAPGWFGGQGGPRLVSHRNLGLTAWVVVAIAALGYDRGIRRHSSDWRSFAVGVWCLAAITVFGAAHWGGTARHKDELPWADKPAVERPALDRPAASP